MPVMIIEYDKEVEGVLERLAVKGNKTKGAVLSSALALYDCIHEVFVEEDKKLRLVAVDQSGKIVKEISFR